MKKGVSRAASATTAPRSPRNRQCAGRERRTSLNCHPVLRHVPTPHRSTQGRIGRFRQSTERKWAEVPMPRLDTQPLIRPRCVVKKIAGGEIFWLRAPRGCHTPSVSWRIWLPDPLRPPPTVHRPAAIRPPDGRPPWRPGPGRSGWPWRTRSRPPVRSLPHGSTERPARRSRRPPWRRAPPGRRRRAARPPRGARSAGAPASSATATGSCTPPPSGAWPARPRSSCSRPTTSARG